MLSIHLHLVSEHDRASVVFFTCGLCFDEQIARDMPDYFASADELYLALVQSSKAHAEIVDVDWSDALKVAGVVGKVDAGDVPASNVTGLWRDEEVFRSKTVRGLLDLKNSRVYSDIHVLGDVRGPADRRDHCQERSRSPARCEAGQRCIQRTADNRHNQG